METFCISLAGVPMRVQAQLRETKAFCRDFFTEEPPQGELVLTGEDIERAREVHIETDLYEGRTPGDYSNRLLETTALHLRVVEVLIAYDAVLFHGCVVAVGGKAYMFCADSGTGKTTHVKLWLKQFPGCHILNGDKPILIVRNGILYACGTPWRGKEHYGTDEILPLAGVCLIERSEENHIEQISFRENLNVLFRHSYRPGGTAELLKYMQVMQKLSEIPLYRLGCNMKDEAAQVSYHAMVDNYESGSAVHKMFR